MAKEENSNIGNLKTYILKKNGLELVRVEGFYNIKDRVVNDYKLSQYDFANLIRGDNVCGYTIEKILTKDAQINKI